VTGPRYGLRFWQGSEEIRLMQIAGSGRIRLRSVHTGKLWWCAPPNAVRWYIYAATEGHTFPDYDVASQTVARLLGRRDTATFSERTE
jgi:hypothetical protein